MILTRERDVPQILLVEDSEPYQKVVIRSLSHCDVRIAGTVDEALAMLGQSEFDLILLDISLPKRDGYSLLSELKAGPSGEVPPVICLTGKTDVTDKVTAFSLGADDYLVKPFDPIELRARVDSKLSKRNRNQQKTATIHAGNIEIDSSRHRVFINESGNKVEVLTTQTEFKLLAYLAKSPGRAYTRDQLLVAAWGEDADVLDRVVDVHLCSLRKKLKNQSHCIQAVPGIGYRFSAEARSSGRKAA